MGNITGPKEAAFKDLLVMDSLRGPDSTGVLGVGGPTIGHRVAKRALHAVDMLDHKSLTSLILRPNVMLLGHNRWATQGGINNINAHPFEFITQSRKSC